MNLTKYKPKGWALTHFKDKPLFSKIKISLQWYWSRRRGLFYRPLKRIPCFFTGHRRTYVDGSWTYTYRRCCYCHKIVDDLRKDLPK